MQASLNWLIIFILFVFQALQQSSDSSIAYFTPNDASAMDIHYASSTIMLANGANIVQYPGVVASSSSTPTNTIPTTHKSRISTLAISPNNQLVFSGGSDYTARIYDIASKAQLCYFDQLRGDIISARIGSDNNTYAFGSDEGYLYYGSISNNCSKNIYINLDYVLQDVQVITSRNQIWVVDGNSTVIVINYATNSTSSFSVPTTSLISIYHMSAVSYLGICTQRAFYLMDYTGVVKFTLANPTIFTYKCRVAPNLLLAQPTMYYLTAVAQVQYFKYSNGVMKYPLWNIWKVDASGLKGTLFHQQFNTNNRYGASSTVVDDAGAFQIDQGHIRVTSIADGFTPLYNYYVDNNLISSCTIQFQGGGLSCTKCNWDETSRPYCDTCNSASGKCASCLSQTYFDSSSKNCFACPSNCYQCSDASTCTICMGNYTLVGSSCVINNLTGCVISYWYGSTVSKCYLCEVGYFPENNLACKTCEEVWANCSVCDVTKCYKCKPNFVMMSTVSTNCEICSHAIQGCAACLNQTYCDTCYETYPYFSFPAVGYRICQPMCQFPCATCPRNDITICLSCDVNRTLVNNTCVCRPQFQIYNSTKELCETCSDFMPNCLNCTNETYCTQCDTSFYFDDLTVGSQTCKACNYSCATCNTKWYQCQTCSPGMSRLLNTVTNRCDCQSISYFEMGTNPNCQLCSNYINNCDVCYNQSYCVTCNSGYYVKANGTGSTICAICTTPCLQCFGTPTNCTDCAAGRLLNYSTRTCDCLQGFYATSPVACAPCSPLLGSCLLCNNGTTCLSCWTNNYFVMVGGLLKCDLCQITCLTCATTVNVCATCDPLANRIMNTVTKQCDCMVGYTETNGRCLNCTATFQHCTACDATKCYSCQPGYSLAFGGLKCVDCQSTYPGCTSCINGVCAACNQSAGYELAYSKCICQPGYYFKQLDCLPYAMGPYVQRLFPAYTTYSQDMNTSTISISIYFRCEGIKLPYGLQNSVRIWIDDQQIISYGVQQQNTTFTFLLSPSAASAKSVIKIVFQNNTVFDLDEYGPAQKEFTFNTNIYFDDKYDLSSSWSTIFSTYIVLVVRWATSILVLLGCADYVIMLVFTVHLLPAFVLLNLNAPLPLLSTLKSMVQINYQSLFIFANINVGYEGYQNYTSLINVFGLAGGVVNRKIMDLVFMGCVLAFYGIICPRMTQYIPEGRLKKLWILKFQLKRYSTFSNTLILFLPSFLFCSIMDLRMQTLNPSSYITISISLLLLSFSCVYIFVHCTILHNTQFDDNFKNQDCYFGSSILQPKSTSYICSLLCIGIVFIQMLGLLKSIYCMPFMIVGVLWYISHFRHWDNFPNKILYFVKLLYGLFLLFFCVSYLMFELGQNYITIDIKTIQLLGLVSLVSILIIFSLAALQTIFLIIYTVYKHCRHSINLVDNIEDQKQKIQQHEQSYDGTVYNMKVTLAQKQKQQQMFNAKLTNKQEHMKKFRQMQLRTASTKMYQTKQQLQTQQGFRATGMSTGSKKKF